MGVEVELDSLAWSEHAQDRALEGIFGQIHIGHIGLVDQHTVACSRIEGLDHTLHPVKRTGVDAARPTPGRYDPSP